MKYLKLYEELFGIRNFWRKPESICKEYGIQNYTINKDGTIDVDGDVYLSNKRLTKLPLKFGNVTGDFICIDNQLTTLVGAPKSTHIFDCSNNKLTSLKGCPQSARSFKCSNNQLTSLEGGPKSVTGVYYCNNNQLTSLVGGPESVGGYFACQYNKLTSLEGGPKSVGRDFDCSDNKLTSLEGGPKSVGGDFDCSDNKLTSFEFFPHVSGNIKIASEPHRINPVYNIWKLFYNKDYIELFNDYDVVRGDSIIIDRLNEFLQEIGKPPVENVKGYKNI